MPVFCNLVSIIVINKNLNYLTFLQNLSHAALARHGDTPREPTAEELQYMQNYTALLQAEKNKERRK